MATTNTATGQTRNHRTHPGATGDNNGRTIGSIGVRNILVMMGESNGLSNPLEQIESPSLNKPNSMVLPISAAHLCSPPSAN